MRSQPQVVDCVDLEKIEFTPPPVGRVESIWQALSSDSSYSFMLPSPNNVYHQSKNDYTSMLDKTSSVSGSPPSYDKDFLENLKCIFAEPNASLGQFGMSTMTSTSMDDETGHATPLVSLQYKGSGVVEASNGLCLPNPNTSEYELTSTPTNYESTAAGGNLATWNKQNFLPVGPSTSDTQFFSSPLDTAIMPCAPLAEVKNSSERFNFQEYGTHTVWDDWWNELAKFKEEYGHCDVPKYHPRNPELAVWVKVQRRQFHLYISGRESKMTKERVFKLQQLNFVFNAQAASRKKCRNN